MTMALHSIGEPAIAQVAVQVSDKKAPPKRRTAAVSDQSLVPEPR